MLGDGPITGKTDGVVAYESAGEWEGSIQICNPPAERLCKEHHESAMKSVDQMMKMMDGAKQSNDPAKMRSALDQSQKHLGEMKEHMAMCGNMMDMM